MRKKKKSIIKQKAESRIENLKVGKKHAQKICKAEKDATVQDRRRKTMHPLENDTRPNTGMTKRLVIRSDILKQAAHAVGKLVEADETGKGGVTLKSLTLAPHIKQKKAVFAVTVETMKYFSILKQLCQDVGLLDGGVLNSASLCVLVKEILLGEGLSRVGPAEKYVMSKETELRRALSNLLTEHGVEDIKGLLGESMWQKVAQSRPRTIRVNLIHTTIQDVMDELGKSVNDIRQNSHIPEVLELPPGVDLHSHRLVRNGNIVLQSLSSCIPAAVLSPMPNWKVIDACAAPGNKTTHLAAIMMSKNGSGEIFAFDKDPRRLERLKRNAERTGSSIINASCIDFLVVDHAEFSNVDAVLLDPSCSGSGTSATRMDYLLPSSSKNAEIQQDTKYIDERIKALSEFQIKVLKHALGFPLAKRVVYSTCSIFEAENENVVASVLEEAKLNGYSLSPAMPQWHRRGTGSKLATEDLEKVLRVDPLEDGTDGFFVALFTRDVDSK